MSISQAYQKLDEITFLTFSKKFSIFAKNIAENLIPSFEIPRLLPELHEDLRLKLIRDALVFGLRKGKEWAE